MIVMMVLDGGRGAAAEGGEGVGGWGDGSVLIAHILVCLLSGKRLMACSVGRG